MARLRGRVRCNRPTLELMRACGFIVEADDFVWRGMPAIVHPLIRRAGDPMMAARKPCLVAGNFQS